VVEGNSKLAASTSLAEIGGPGLAGALVQVVSAPFAILVDALSYVVSAVSLGLIRTPEPARPPRIAKTHIRREIIEGLLLVRHHPILVPLTLRSVIAHVAGSFYGVLYTIFLIDELHLDPFVLGKVESAQPEEGPETGGHRRQPQHEPLVDGQPDRGAAQEVQGRQGIAEQPGDRD